MEMIAKENLPEPLKVAKDHIDSAVVWVTGKDSEGDTRFLALRFCGLG